MHTDIGYDRVWERGCGKENGCRTGSFGGEFVDWETGACEFDGEYFKEVLSFAANYNPPAVEWSYL